MTALLESQANKVKNLKTSDNEIDDENEQEEYDDDDDESMDESNVESGDNDTDIDAEDEDEDGEAQSSGNVGWADTFAKVLQQEKPKNRKYLVLSRAKKLNQQKPDGVEDDDEKPLTFQIDGSGVKTQVSSHTKTEQEDDEKPPKEQLQLSLISQKERNNKLLDLRVKPSLMDRERERAFKRIATKGVVQLFNAVRTQQRDLVDRLEKAGPLDHRRDAVLNNINKRQFLDVLMGGKRAKSENVDNPVKDEGQDNDDDDGKPSQWSVLRDDFMTNKQLTSHWENDEDSDNENDQKASADDSDSS